MIELGLNAKRRNDKKLQIYYNSRVKEKGLENEIIEKNKTISNLRNQFNIMRSKDIIDHNFFLIKTDSNCSKL